MFDEPEENQHEAAADPKVRAQEKSDELRIHAQLAAVFEGPRKFDAAVHTDLDADLARQVQRHVARLEKAKEQSPILPPSAIPEAIETLQLPDAQPLTLNDYHVYRRPGEVMILRWLVGEQVETFYERLQAHFDAALTSFRDEQRAALEWKGDEQTLAYLDALDKLDAKMAERFLRPLIIEHGAYVLSTVTADEINIRHLCDFLMGTPAEDVVGEAYAPPTDATDEDLAWFFKLFGLRGKPGGVERMCWFTYLQKAGDDFF